MKNSTLISSLLLSIFISSSALAVSLPPDGSLERSGPPTPPSSSIKGLRIVAGNGTSNTSIYANGNMQAKLNVFYDIESGDSLKNISIKELYTAATLSQWNVTDIKNQHFSNDLISRSSGPQNLSQSYLTKYLTTNSQDIVSACVELTTRNGSFKSTCDGDSNQSFVRIEALEDQSFTVADWDKNLHTKMKNSLGHESWLRGYTPPNGRKIAYVDYKGSYARNGRTPNNAKVIFASPSYNSTVRKGQSTLYVFKPNTGVTSKTFYYGAISGNNKQYKTYTVNNSGNTTNSLVFVTNYIWNYKYAISLNPIHASTYFIGSIDVYDTYGSKTTFRFSRDGLGVNII
ncbi:hypothetical protein [Aliivibrio sp. SR45-2]|uniref:hypothetical protein n=1 Tax=Aliivibrio sp. SR45-2 TaxID=2760931 RepID=UPI0015F8ED97|nr:hypothetical protein [Aliivibrio sp. SR45-2]MBB1315630.1 hypothetical protein [Aliivibrio sp. SR45-2]